MSNFRSAPLMRQPFGTFPTTVWTDNAECGTGRRSDPVSISPVFHVLFQLSLCMNSHSRCARSPYSFLSFSSKMFLCDCRPLRLQAAIFIVPTHWSPGLRRSLHSRGCQTCSKASPWNSLELLGGRGGLGPALQGLARETSFMRERRLTIG